MLKIFMKYIISEHDVLNIFFFLHPEQFDYVAQHLVFANCIPLILKFFNQNIMSYISAKNR